MLRWIALSAALIVYFTALVSICRAEAEARERVTVVLLSGEMVRGTIADANEESLIIDRGGTSGPFYDAFREIPKTAIRSIEAGNYRPPSETLAPWRRFHSAIGPSWIRGGDSFRSRWDMGWRFGMSYTFISRPDAGLGVGFDVDVAGYGSRVEDLTDFSSVLMGAHVRYALVRSPSTVSPSVLVGLGAASYSFDADWFPHAASATDPYVAFGFRLDGRAAGRLRLFAETRYDAVLGDVGSFGLASVSGGIGI